MDTNIDFYQLLQVGFHAEKADIVSAYRRLSKLYHPDISVSPQAHQLMAQINIAYDTLSNDVKRQAYNSTLGNSLGKIGLKPSAKAAEEAQSLITEYFSLLVAGNYGRAFQLLCASDRGRVGLRAFTDWRQAVQELYSIREFHIRRGQHLTSFELEKNRAVPAIKFFVDVQEKDHTFGRLENYCFTKYVVLEQGHPGVYLGYRDLGEISKTFSSRLREREQTLMQQNWQKHQQHYDRLTGLLSREGLLNESKPELYCAQRYKRPLTVALLSFKPARQGQEKLSEACLEVAAQTLKKSLRLTDIPAHLGNGLFAILFFELKKRHAPVIVERMLKKAGQSAGNVSKTGMRTSCAFEPYVSGPLDGYLQRLNSELHYKNS